MHLASEDKPDADGAMPTTGLWEVSCPILLFYFHREWKEQTSLDAIYTNW